MRLHQAVWEKVGGRAAVTDLRRGQWAWAGGLGGQPMAALEPGAGRRGCESPCGKRRGGGSAEVRLAGVGGGGGCGGAGAGGGGGRALAAGRGLVGRPHSPAPPARRSVRGLLPAVLPRPAPWACGRGPRARERMGTQGSPVKSYDYLLKFLLVGDSDVGKGEILESLQDGAAESPYAYSNGKAALRARPSSPPAAAGGLPARVRGARADPAPAGSGPASPSPLSSAAGAPGRPGALLVGLRPSWGPRA